MPVENSPERVAQPAAAANAVCDPAGMQEFWTGQRAEQERRKCREHPLFAADTKLSEAPSELIYDSIAAGCEYHKIWTQELLTKLHDAVDSKMFKATDPGAKEGLSVMKKALQSRGGAKGQARSVGMVIFRTATELHAAHAHENWNSDDMWNAGNVQNENSSNNANQAAKRKSPQQQPLSNKRPCSEPELDEQWPQVQYMSGFLLAFPPPAYKFLCFILSFSIQGVLYTLSPELPEGAAVAVRDSPSADGKEVGKAGAGSELTVIGRKGDWLKLHFDGPAWIMSRKCCSYYWCIVVLHHSF